ncbi:MAG: hypothetical protein GY940_28780 [bacterium]|nr:hypothetical protein [bacterium]
MSRIQANRKILLFLIMIMALFTGQARGEQGSSPGDNLYNKVMCGYQGWFSTPGDGFGKNSFWRHWCVGPPAPTPGTITIDAWPDFSEYPPHTLFYSDAYDWRYPDGSEAGFFSSNLEETVMLHCKWMRDYGIDGVYLQRFVNELSDPNDKARRDVVLGHLMKGAERYGLKVVVMYDINGTQLQYIAQWIINDWMNLVNERKIHESPGYQYHPDRTGQYLPVVVVWGFGFKRMGTKGEAGKVIDFFKNNANPRYKATLIGGIPGRWRSGQYESKAGYEGVYAGFDVISPWTVGGYRDEAAVEGWRTGIMADDLVVTGKLGQEYLPVCFPGFSNSNLRRNLLDKKIPTAPNPAQLNRIPRNGGHFIWSQFYHWSRAGNNMFYIAMFDEVDEGTAIFKVAADSSKVPGENLFLHLGIDGYSLQSDHYLWLTGIAGFLLKQELPFSPVQPRRFPKDWFQVERFAVNGFFGENPYVRFNIKMDNHAVERVGIYEKSDNTGFHKIADLNKNEFQKDEYTFNHKIFDKNGRYTYILVGFDANGFPVGFSDMKHLIRRIPVD